MRIILRLAKVPFILWLIIGGGLAYMDYTDWQQSVWEPLVNQKEVKQGQLAGFKRESSKAEDFRRKKEEKLRELQALSDKLEMTRQKYPTSPNIPQLLKDLADTADRTGLEFHNFKPQPEKRQEFVVTTPIEVKIRGTYVQIMSFLDTAANLKRAVVAEKLSLDTPTSRDRSVSLINATASLVTYSIEDKLDATPPPPAPGAPKSSAPTPPAGGAGAAPVVPKPGTANRGAQGKGA
ncbi:MAG: type 4a pilus biogenesis protein PilO [Bdellovibrionales bacterium]|nr:type 4a pilus biogenesis protein PilO [Bdellovibrionales bacterium]